MDGWFASSGVFILSRFILVGDSVRLLRGVFSSAKASRSRFRKLPLAPPYRACFFILHAAGSTAWLTASQQGISLTDAQHF